MEPTNILPEVSHTRINIALPSEMIAELITSADMENITIAQFITEAIQEAIKKHNAFFIDKV